jgi:glycosyltransferase involved in cell wall biosynthesis
MNSRFLGGVKKIAKRIHDLPALPGCFLNGARVDWYNGHMKQPKVALVHDYLVQYGGAEKTLEAICEIFPEAPIYTGVYSPEEMSDVINSKEIHTTKSNLFRRFPKHLTFLMPLVFENFDLSAYDIIISDGTAWPKSVLTKPNQLHISYVHTPPRFLYKYSVETTKRNAWYFKPFVTIIDHLLRIWDFAAAQRPDYLLTNSCEVKKRIQKFYSREAEVIYPPVEINIAVEGKTESPEKTPAQEEFFLALGRLAAYKNFHELVAAFENTKHKLVIAGTGPEEEALRNSAAKIENVELLGRVSQEKKYELLSKALGVINPVQDEDFGIVPIEAMSQGTPVLGYRAGGHLETIQEDITGMLFDQLDPENLANHINTFYEKIKSGQYNKEALKNSVQRFSKKRFKKELNDFVMEKWHARTT